MHRIALTLFALLSSTAAIAGADGLPDRMPNAGKLPPQCQRPERLKVDGPAKATAQRLGDLPPATHLMTVYREVDGCPVPLVVRNDVGMPGAARPRR